MRTQMRMLNLHEYQSKALMQKFDIRVQKFKVADKAEDAQKYAEQLGTFVPFFRATPPPSALFTFGSRPRDCDEGPDPCWWPWQGHLLLGAQERRASDEKVRGAV
jgi:hypothetical protein